MARRLTEAFKRLRLNLERGEVLLDKFFDNPAGKQRKAGQPKSHEQELLRSVLVLTVGALENGESVWRRGSDLLLFSFTWDNPTI